MNCKKKKSFKKFANIFLMQKQNIYFNHSIMLQNVVTKKCHYKNKKKKHKTNVNSGNLGYRLSHGWNVWRCIPTDNVLHLLYQQLYPNLGLVHPVAPVFNENHKSIASVRNLSRLYCTQYNTTLRVSAIRPSSGVSYIQKC
jgi:hypothetical protein